MKGFKFLNAAQYAALTADAKVAYDAAVLAFAKTIGASMEINLRIRKVVISISNPAMANIITVSSDTNPFMGGVVPTNVKMLDAWARDQGLTPLGYRMMLNQGGATLTGEVRVVFAGDSYDKKDGTTGVYKCPSLRLENPSIEIGGTFSKTISVALANAAVKAAMHTATVADDDDDVAY